MTESETHDLPEEQSKRIAAEGMAEGDPTGWFDRLYAESERSGIPAPWDVPEPQFRLAEWAASHADSNGDRLDGKGRRALVVGCGLGRDSEFIAAHGYDTVAFDISETAVRAIQRRFPSSTVSYVAADLLDPPAEWAGAFDLVIESLTVQALPRALRSGAIANVAQFVAPGGTLVVIAGDLGSDDPDAGPPWRLTSAELDEFTRHGLSAV